jgi:hypothetical protein
VSNPGIRFHTRESFIEITKSEEKAFSGTKDRLENYNPETEALVWLTYDLPGGGHFTDLGTIPLPPGGSEEKKKADP